MTDQERMVRAGVIALAVDYSRSNPFDYVAHMSAAHIAFFLFDRSGLSLTQQVSSIQEAHIVVARMEKITLSQHYKESHELIHSLLGAKLQQMQEAGLIPPFIEMSPDHQEELRKYDSDFQEWTKQLQEPEES